MVRILWLVAVLAISNSAMADTAAARPVLTDIDPECHLLGANWEADYGLRIDDLSDLQGLSRAEREVADTLIRQLQPLHIIAVADYSCLKTDAPLDVATVRVFVFENAALASDWWQKKYEYDNWEQHYTKLTGAKFATVDSTQTPKRAMLVGNIWTTSHHIRPGTEHEVLLESVVEELQTAQ